MVILADKLNRIDALDLETDLITRAKNAPRNSKVFKKFASKAKEGRHYSNDGGKSKTTADDPIHSVYIAYWQTPA
jgi:hypothetical protein